MAEDIDRLAQRYIAFAEREAKDRSPLYYELATAIAGDREVLTLVAAFPADKQQPNLLLAAMKYVCGTSADWGDFRAALLKNIERVAAIMMMRRTQTNEAARCATLLPLLALLPQPFALLEVGAAAGLCLIPDRYSYNFDGSRLRDDNPSAPTLVCSIGHMTLTPTQRPAIAWRAGLDLSPIDPRDAEEARWLEALVWPGEERRLDNLRAALSVAASDPPRVVQGDLRTDFAALAGEAPKDVPLVVFHTAVLSYVWPQADRDAFAGEVQRLAQFWICNEGIGVFPQIDALAPTPHPPDKMLMSLNGEPFAWSDPHGTDVSWFALPSVLQAPAA